jgi:uncharacterized OsmC-like protein
MHSELDRRHGRALRAWGFWQKPAAATRLMMDGAPDAAKPANGGQNLAPRPMETVLAGTGGCTAYDVVLILKRGRHDVQGCSVKLTSERAAGRPQGVHQNPHAIHRDGQGHPRQRPWSGRLP